MWEVTSSSKEPRALRDGTVRAGADSHRPGAGWPRPPAASTGMAEPEPRASRRATPPPPTPHTLGRSAPSSVLLRQSHCQRPARTDRPPALEVTTSLEVSEGSTGGGSPQCAANGRNGVALRPACCVMALTPRLPCRLCLCLCLRKSPELGQSSWAEAPQERARSRLAAPWTPFPVGFCSEPNCTRGERSPLRVKRQRPSEGLQESQEISRRG